MKKYSILLFVLLLAVLAIAPALSACAPLPAQPNTAQLPAATAAPVKLEFATLTPAPAEPTEAPTSAGECETAGLQAYTSPQGDYCFAHPDGFNLDLSSDDGAVLLSGPALDQSPEPLRASLRIEVQPVAKEAQLSRLVDAYLSQAPFVAMQPPIPRAESTLGGEPAEVLEDVPGLLSARIVMALHEGHLYTLRFHPSDAPQAGPDLEALYQAVSASFRFLPGTPKYAAPAYEMVWAEFDHVIQVVFDPAPALWVEVATVPAVPLDPSIMYAESHPAAVRYRFLGYQGGMGYLLPYPFTEAQLNLYATKDFPGYGDDQPTGFSPNLTQLRGLLADRPPLVVCDTLHIGEPLLPFLPWLNSAPVFCAHPAYIEFEGGSGIRYLASYSQGVGVPTDDWIFYTFQGLSDDGEIYLSGVFPARTGVFPTQPDPNFDIATWEADLQSYVQQLQAASGKGFLPSLVMLDGWVKGISLRKP